MRALLRCAACGCWLQVRGLDNVVRCAMCGGLKLRMATTGVGPVCSWAHDKKRPACGGCR